MKVRSHLLLIAVVAGIPGLVVAMLLMWWSAELQQARIEDGIRETARALSQAVDRELYRGRGIARTIAASAAIDLGRFERVHSQAAALTDHSEWIVLTHPDGAQVVNSLRPYGEELPRVASVEVVKHVVETKTGQFGSLVLGAVAGRPIVTVGAPVIRDREVRYVVLFASSVDRFQGLLETQNLPKGWIASITDQHHITIARNLDPERWVAKPVGPTLRPLLAQSLEGTSSGPTREGISVFFAWTTSPVSGWTVTVGAPTEIVNAPMRTMFLSFVIAVAFVLGGIAAAVIIGRRVNQRITQSVSELSNAAVAMGHGTPIALHEGANISEIDAVTKSLRWAHETIQERALDQQRTREEAIAANRAKDQFIATLAHEVRTPLAAIATASEVLERTIARPETAIIRRQVKHLSAMVNELFDAARITLNKFVLVKAPLDLTQTVHECIESLTFDRDRYEVVLTAPEHVWIEADAIRIQQVISNLVTNATKFTPKGGTISVRVERRLDAAVIEITDPGIGISPKLIPRVFELFFQGEGLQRTDSGLGIGLSLVRRLIELHGGKVAAFSEGKDKGSTFTVTLPCIEPEAEANRSEAAA